MLALDKISEYKYLIVFVMTIIGQFYLPAVITLFVGKYSNQKPK